MKPFTDYPVDEQARAVALHRVFLGVDAAAQEQGLLKALRLACEKAHGLLVDVPGGAPVTLNLPWGATGATPRRWYARWRRNPSPLACLRQYRAAVQSVVPQDILDELNRLATLKGVRNNKTAITELKRRWYRGERLCPLAGQTGDWREYWATAHPDKPVPATVPAFPWSDKTLYKRLPRRDGAVKKLGVEGVFSAKNAVKTMLRDSSGLAPGQAYTADDIELEVLCIYTATGKLTVCKIYVMMEWGSRRIVAYTLRPGNGLLERDVRNLLLRGLATCGLCATGPTHIILERGSLALSERSVAEFETYLEGRVQIHRTEMIRGRSWAGAAPDAASGNPRGKGIVEAFARKLHELLRLRKGQRGNTYEVQPANLGFVGQHRAPRPGSVAAEAEALARVVTTTGGAVRLELPLDWSHELEAALAEAIRDYNATRGHSMQGFHEHTQQWDDLLQNWKDLA